MKNPQRILQTVAAFAAAAFIVQSSHAAVVTWNNALGGNWSVGANWDILSAPTSADDARFGNVSAGTPTTMDASITVNSLAYGQDNGSTHTTTINPGQTLNVSRVGAGDVLYVGSTSVSINNNTLVPVTISGAGALTLSGTGDLVVKQGHANNGTHMATLDLSGVDTFTANVGRLLVGQGTGTAINRPSGTLILAKTNHITLSGASPQVMIQDGGQNANGSVASVLTFGQVTELNGNVMRLGGQKGNATLNFNGIFSMPSLKIRGVDGVSRVTVMDFGYNGAAPTTGNNTVCGADFSPGTVDIAATLINIAQGSQAGVGQCTGTLTVGAGVVDADNLEIGWGNANTASASGQTTGNLNVNNNGFFASGALVRVNTQLRLGRTNSPAGPVTGNLTINGGAVHANTIVAGGGVSTINVNAGSTLIITNSAGTLAFPIRNFGLSDATLRVPALNGGAVVAVSNLTVSGSANTINISSIPPIASYPVTFTLINYLGGYTPGAGPLSLGSLPAASPAYAGTLVDVGGGVIQLQLTSGPVVDLSLRWTGVADGSWDSFTQNWLYQGNATNFFAGAATLFNDSTTRTNVDLTEAVSPGSVTVSNNLYAYSFSGIGNIAGASALIKRGTSSLTIDNAGANTVGNVQILGGTLRLGSGGTDGSITAISITNNGALIINRDGASGLSAVISGTGSLTKTGPGALTLSGANSYGGITVLAGGTLQIDGASGAGSLSTSNGTVLAGSGTINGLATVRGQLNPGPVTGPGAFKAHGGLTLASGATLAFNLSATDPSNPAVNDSVEVIGNLSLNNNVIAINIAGTPQNGASYLLFTYTGTLSGSFNPTVAGTHYAASIDTTTPGAVYLNITGSAGADLKWNSTSDAAWDSATANWQNLNTLAASLFFAGDSALLDDTFAVVPGITIDSGLTMTPSVVTNDSDMNAFSISGSGRIGGSASIVKSGSSTLVIGTPNNFTGPVDVYEGTVQTDNDSALGTTLSGTVVHDGATLNLNGRNLGGETITVSGAGVGGQGAIVNNGAGQNQSLRQVVLAGDTTFGGSGLWAMNNGGGTASLSTGGNPYSLTKVGANQVNLAQLASVDAALADIDIQQGTLEFSGNTSSMGDPARTNFVQAGATLAFANGTVAWNKYFVLNGNGLNNTINNGAGANADLVGSVELHGDCIFNVGGTLLSVSSAIAGDGGIIKNGGSPMILHGVNTYKGDTRINTAALRLNGTATIANSSNIIINAGATLTVTGRVDSTFTLVNSQTLKGNGVINGHLIASAGSTVAPGIDAIGALTISNTISLGGSTVMELDEANATNDVLRCNGSVTYGGTLNLVNLGGSLSAGASFKLFNAASYLGTFSSINPATPGPGQTWNTSALNSSGTISVIGSPTALRFSGVSLTGNSLVMSGSNGVPFATYYVRASTDVGLALATWPRVATNAFNASGQFTFTTNTLPSMPVRFYAIEQP